MDRASGQEAALLLTRIDALRRHAHEQGWQDVIDELDRARILVDGGIGLAAGAHVEQAARMLRAQQGAN